MQEIRTKGIVIDTKDYKEYDKLITILTYDMGVITAVIKGVKKGTAKSRFAGQVFCFIDIILSKKGEYYTIISCDLIESFFEIAYNYEKFLLAVDIVKVVKYVSRHNPESSELFVVFLSILNVLLKTNAPNNIVYLKFLLMTIKALGFNHEYIKCDMCHSILEDEIKFNINTGAIVCANCASKGNIGINLDSLKLIKKVMDTDYIDLESINISDETGVAVLTFVQKMFKVHVNQ